MNLMELLGNSILLPLIAIISYMRLFLLPYKYIRLLTGLIIPNVESIKRIIITKVLPKGRRDRKISENNREIERKRNAHVIDIFFIYKRIYLLAIKIIYFN